MALVRTDMIDVLALAQKQPLFVPGNERAMVIDMLKISHHGVIRRKRISKSTRS